MGSNTLFNNYFDSEVLCPACYNRGVVIFYEVSQIPGHCCVLMKTREAALECPRRDLRLGYCNKCGFVHNTIFDPMVPDYSETYEETQGFSPTFQAFSNKLAKQIIEKFQLSNKKILEIGCGKGEFLYTLCKLSGNQGIGIDPTYVPGRLPQDCDKYVTFIREFYKRAHGDLKPDFIFSRHTLEHIHEVRKFMDLVRASTQNRALDIWFDLPDAHRVWQEGAFWDIYYEHASYFSAGTVARLFQLSGFELTGLSLEYGNQWISIGARSLGAPSLRFELEDDLEQTAKDIEIFQKRCHKNLSYWRERLNEVRGSGGRSIIWGGGSKGVAFLTTLGVGNEVEYVIDINPHKQGKFMPGSGHQVFGVSELQKHPPSLVIIMNPIYNNEIKAELSRLGIEAEIDICE